jgi:hypothetical protein
MPSVARSPTWNFTEFVPTSMTAYRAAPKPTRALSPRGKLTLGRESNARSRTVRITRAASSNSIAIVRAEPRLVRTSVNSAMQPAIV